MRCVRCGNVVSDDARFCSGCGNQLKADSQVAMEPYRGQQTAQYMYSEEMEIIKRIDKALPIYQTVENMEYELQVLEKKKAASSIGIGEIIIAFVISVFISIFFACATYSKDQYIHSVKVGCVTFLVSLVVIIVIENKLAKHAAARIDRDIQNKSAQRKRFMEENYTPELNYLPEKYRYVIAAQYIRECIANQRAHDLTAAINLYEEQLYRWKMENYQRYLCAINAQKRRVDVFVW